MTDSCSTNPGSSKAKRILRRVFEFVTAAILLLAILYWPTTNMGRLFLIAAVVVCLVGLKFLSKWPSS
jgi:hypothetical protein